MEGLLEEMVAPGNWQRGTAVGGDARGAFKLSCIGSSEAAFPYLQKHTHTHTHTGSPSPHEPALFSCLLLNMVTVCVETAGKEFDQLMQLMAYPLMQKLGHSNTMVSNHALNTLKTICSHCGYRLAGDHVRSHDVM